MLVVLTLECFARVKGSWVFGQEQLVCDSIEEAMSMIADAVRIGSKTAGRDNFKTGEGQVRISAALLPVRDRAQVMRGMREGAKHAARQVGGERYTLEEAEAIVEEALEETKGVDGEEPT